MHTISLSDHRTLPETNQRRPDSANFDHLIGKKIGTSVLLKEIGRGGMAVIFSAYQGTLKQRIAIKILPKEFSTPRKTKWFYHEAQLLATLSHPNILKVYEAGEEQNLLFIAMEIVTGRSLAEHIRLVKRRPLSTKRFISLGRTIEITLDVLNALGYAHQRNIVHGDVKPGNVLIEKGTNRIVLADFGLARAASQPNESSTVVVGSPFYMAPEQIVNGFGGKHCDIYSAGVMLFEMLVSTLPCAKPSEVSELLSMKVKLGKNFFRKRPSEINLGLEPAIDDIVLKAIAYDPAERYTTCEDFSQALKTFSESHLS